MKWISVKDELPSTDEEFLVYVFREGWGTYQTISDYDVRSGTWAIGSFEFEVTHWMPLPEPPEGE